MFPEWNPYLQRIKNDEHRRRLQHVERIAEYRPTRKQRR
jgi:hypothetical protein